jgi:hypothetical protein
MLTLNSLGYSLGEFFTKSSVHPDDVDVCVELFVQSIWLGLPDFLVQKYRNGKKYTELTLTIPNGHKTYHVVNVPSIFMDLELWPLSINRSCMAVPIGMYVCSSALTHGSAHRYVCMYIEFPRRTQLSTDLGRGHMCLFLGSFHRSKANV